MIRPKDLDTECVRIAHAALSRVVARKGRPIGELLSVETVGALANELKRVLSAIIEEVENGKKKQ